MSVNLATKYEKQFDAQFARTAFLEGKYNNKYNFNGAKTIMIYSPVTTELVDYTRNGANRYGTPTELDSTLQELTLIQDKGFTKTLDRGNYNDSMMSISAGAWMQEEIRSVCTPTIEKYALSKWINSGNFKKIDAVPTKNTIVSALTPLYESFRNEYVPNDGRYLYIRPDMLSAVMLSTEWQSADKLAEKAMENGVVGKFRNAKVVEVPEDYLPENCYAALISKRAVMLAKKLSEFKTHIDPPGVSGWLLEGRIYYDAFVLAQKNAGVCTLVLKDKQATVSISAAGVLTVTNAKKTYYTTDGSDPRYSSTREQFTGTSGTDAVGASGDTIKAWAEGDGVLASDVVTKKRTS